MFNLLFTAVGLFSAPLSPSPPPVVFSKQILPMFKERCWTCHGGSMASSGFSLNSRESMMKGGRHGDGFVVGKGTQSSLVRYMTGELKPKMPPDGSIDLETIGIVRRWIDEGAKVDTMVGPASPNTLKASAPIPKSPVHAMLPAPITALAFAPTGTLLAVSGYGSIRIYDIAKSDWVTTVTGAIDQVQAIAWSPDGNRLAAACGSPGVSGDVILFDTKTWRPTGKLVGHTDVVYAVAWRPNGRDIATGSLDKTIRVWDSTTGNCTKVLKDHADNVSGVAWSPDGKYLASASGDRTCKVFEADTWKRLAALQSHQEGLTSVVFSPEGKLLVTTGIDKQMKVWNFKPSQIENPARSQGEGEIINHAVYSPDGKILAWCANNHVIKLFNADGSQMTREWREPLDWVYSVAIAADNLTVAAGSADGHLFIYDIKSGKLVRDVPLIPVTAK
ncbi:MAG: c-type cytochrome domain-containing protein [Chthonomonadales bacterium]